MINEIKTKIAIITAEAIGNQILVTHQYRHFKTGVERVNRYWLNHCHLARLIKFKQVDALLRYAKAFDKSEHAA